MLQIQRQIEEDESLFPRGIEAGLWISDMTCPSPVFWTTSQSFVN